MNSASPLRSNAQRLRGIDAICVVDCGNYRCRSQVDRTILSIFISLWMLVGTYAHAQYATEGATPLRFKSLGELQHYLHDHKPDVDLFRRRGPFGVEVHKNYGISLSTAHYHADALLETDAENASSDIPKTTERIKADLFLSRHGEKAPLLVFMHGYMGSRASHHDQAMHVASWGMHCLTLEMPNERQWVANGRILARVVDALSRSPDMLDGRIDVNKIILVGYSFGGTSAAVALALGAPAIGGILLDPAVIGRNTPELLTRINASVAVLGADPRINYTIDRDYFFRYIRGDVAEVSVKGATHKDAQTSADAGLTSPSLQVTFVSAVISAAFSLAASGKLDYAWASFQGALKNGKLFIARKK
jgi:pimeloyl-ACP methyl ester carboxylesterase